MEAKKLKVLHISYTDSLKYLNLTVEQLKHISKIFDINYTPTKFTLNQYNLFEIYLKKIGHKKIKKAPKKAFFEEIKEEKILSLEELINNRRKVKTVAAIKEQPKHTISINNKSPNIPIYDDSRIEINDEKVVKKTSSPKIHKKIKKKEITGVVDNNKLFDQITKKDKTKILDNSYLLSRYDIYCKDCELNKVIPISIEIYKNFKKEAPINYDYCFDDIWKDTTEVQNSSILNGGFRKVKSAKAASKIYNNGYVLYYSCKGKGIGILCKFDTTKPFASNLSTVTTNYRYGIFDYYLNGDKFDTNDIIPIITNKGKEYTKEEDKKILAFYNGPDYADTKKKTKGGITLKELAAEMKVDTKSIRNRAIELGFTNFKSPREKKWTDPEYELLKKCIGKYNPKKIEIIFREHGFTRGFVAIGIKITRMRLSRALDGSEEMNLKSLAKAMGVDSHFFYDNKRLKKLKAIEENNQWIMERKNIKEYLINNPYDYSLAKVEPKWYIDIISSSSGEQNG